MLKWQKDVGDQWLNTIGVIFKLSVIVATLDNDGAPTFLVAECHFLESGAGKLRPMDHEYQVDRQCYVE